MRIGHQRDIFDFNYDHYLLMYHKVSEETRLGDQSRMTVEEVRGDGSET